MKNNSQIIKKLLLLTLCFYLNVSCNNSQTKTESNIEVIKSPEIQNDNLKDTAAELSELYNNKNCKGFINRFPNTFQELDQLYGYDDEKGGRILYSKLEHITYFFECSEVSDREKLEKVIKIGIDGKWDADAIGMFQDSAFNLTKSHIKEAEEILDKLSDEKAASFWFFIFDGPHPSDKENVSNFKSLNKLLGEKSKQSKILSGQFQKLLKLEKEDKNSGVIGRQ